MIKISNPYIKTRENKVFLCSHIVDEYLNIDEEVWYSSDMEYGKFFVDEVSDAFVLPMLILATKNDEDVVVEGYISEKLLYNITHNILYTIALPYNKKSNFRFTCIQGGKKTDFKPFAVGCGCSLGVDSFSAMLRHMGDDCLPSFRLTHLTNFNVGAYGII